MKAMLIAIPILIFGVVNAFGEMATFKDVQKPDGHERGRTERRADFRACGAGVNYEIPVAQFPAFRHCMQEHGWGLDHVTRNAEEAARDRAADEKARPWCYGAYCAPDDSECMENPSNTFSICNDSP
jgi:hypothetical protein